MREVRIEAGRNTPEIVLNPDGYIRFRGRSIHENAEEFYEPVVNWVKEYIENPAEVTVVEIRIEYFNSPSARTLIRIMQKLVYVSVKNKKHIFNWYYEDGDEDILERGEYFSSVLSVPFNFIKV